MQFDYTLGKLFCLYKSVPNGKFYLSTLNPATGNFTFIDTIPGMKTYQQNWSSGYDQENHYYVFNGRDTGSHDRLVTLNTTNVQVVNNVPWPYPVSPHDNLAFPFYDTARNTTYAIIWIDSECKAPPITVSSITNTSALVSWNSQSWWGLGYNYIISASAITPPPPMSNYTANSSILASGLLPNTTFYVCAQKQCLSGLYSDWSCDSFTTTADSTNMVSGIKSSKMFDVYPNPATERLNIRSMAEGVTIIINNIIGQTVYHNTIHSPQETINIAQWPSGTYLLYLSDNAGNRKVHKMVKE
jgi:hypothetical protein